MTTCHSSSNISMTNTASSGMVRYHESTKTVGHQTEKSPPPPPSSSDGLPQKWVNLFRWFLHSILQWPMHNPIAFAQLGSLTRWLKPPIQELWLVWDAIFTFYSMYKNSHITTNSELAGQANWVLLNAVQTVWFCFVIHELLSIKMMVLLSYITFLAFPHHVGTVSDSWQVWWLFVWLFSAPG